MIEFPKKYIIDEHNHKVAVQLDIDTFQKIEELLENFGLTELMKQNVDDEKLSIAEAKVYYQTLDKAE